MSDSRDPIVFTGSGIVCGAGGSVAEVWEKLASGETAGPPLHPVRPAKWPCRSRRRSSSPTASSSATGSSTRRSRAPTCSESTPPSRPSPIPACRPIATPCRGRPGGLERPHRPRRRHRRRQLQEQYDFLPLMTEAEASPDGALHHFGKELSNQVTPMWLLKNLPNNVLCHVGIRGQYKGTNACITNQCSSGILAVAEAAYLIQNGEAERIAAAGHDSPFEPEMVYYYHKLGLMSRRGPASLRRLARRHGLRRRLRRPRA